MNKRYISSQFIIIIIETPYVDISTLNECKIRWSAANDDELETYVLI